MYIVVIDGQSGRLGSQLIEELRKAGIGAPHQVIAVGTNALASSAMLKAGADGAATGENPVIVACTKADVIMGPVGIVMADALLGEVTPAMAVAVGRSSAAKLLLPVSKCGNYVVGVQDVSRSQLVDEAVAQVLRLCQR